MTDSDQDGLSDELENAIGTDAHLQDTDHDGLDDGREIRFGSSPLETDSDHDGVEDLREIAQGTNPMDSDPDGDTDWLEQLDRQRAEEQLAAADGGQQDSDGDGIPDLAEVYLTHTDPDS